MAQNPESWHSDTLHQSTQNAQTSYFKKDSREEGKEEYYTFTFKFTWLLHFV